MTDERRIPEAPIHPLAALATLALDGFFSVFEILDPLLLVFTSVGVGILGFLTTTLNGRSASCRESGFRLCPFSSTTTSEGVSPETNLPCPSNTSNIIDIAGNLL